MELARRQLPVGLRDDERRSLLDGRVVVRPASVVAGNKPVRVANATPVAQRIGVAVVRHGDFKSNLPYSRSGPFRKGTLLAVYDIRYNHSGDLPANIDVGVSRSTDGGRTWSDVKIAIDDSKIDPLSGGYQGRKGDPAILVDEKTGAHLGGRHMEPQAFHLGQQVRRQFSGGLWTAGAGLQR